MKRIVTLIVFSVIRLHLQAQVVDTVPDYSNDFNRFRNDITKDFINFRESNDSLFLLFLEESWRETEGRQNVMPVSPKPPVQPVFDNTGDSSLQISPREDDSATGYLIPAPRPDDVAYAGAVSFYGSIINLPPYDNSMPLLHDVSKQAVTAFYMQASSNQRFRKLISDIRARAVGYGLNDWGYYSLLSKVAGFYYTDNNNVNAFLWAALLMSGINVKAGVNSKNLYLLVPADVTIYNVSFTLRSTEYYALGNACPSPGEKLYIHEADYPGNRDKFILNISGAPVFEPNPLVVFINNDKTLKLTLNKNLLDYYHNYPQCDLSVHLNTPVSDLTGKQLDDLLLNILENQNDDIKTEMLLRFVQRAFSYSTDKKLFGFEKYQFAEEVLLNGAGDCEDRTSLLAALLQRYTRHNLIGLRYPGHISLGVSLKVCDSPAIISYDGRPFYNCDPTYLGARCGMIMPSLKEQNPAIIKINTHEI